MNTLTTPSVDLRERLASLYQQLREQQEQINSIRELLPRADTIGCKTLLELEKSLDNSFSKTIAEMQETLALLSEVYDI